MFKNTHVIRFLCNLKTLIFCFISKYVPKSHLKKITAIFFFSFRTSCTQQNLTKPTQAQVLHNLPITSIVRTGQFDRNRKTQKQKHLRLSLSVFTIIFHLPKILSKALKIIT